MKTIAALIPFLLATASVNALVLPGGGYHVGNGTGSGPVEPDKPSHGCPAPEEFFPISINEHGIVYSKVAPTEHQKRDTPEGFYPISTNKDGTVYSNVAPTEHQKRDTPEGFYPISTNKDGTVYSNVAPTEHQKRDTTAYTPLSDDEVEKYIEEK